MSTVFVAEKKLPIDVIRIDGGTQARCHINQDMVDHYATLMADDVVFPPGVAFFDGKEYWLADGFHRYHALRKNDRHMMICRIVNGTVRDAILYSFGANGTHGMQMTNEDKRRVVLEMLNDFEWNSWSDREIARACHVSHPFVAKVRASFDGPEPSTYKYKDGSGEVKERQRKPKKTSAAGNVTITTPVAEVTDKPDEKLETIQYLIEENEKLKDQLAAGAAEDPEFTKNHLEELREELKMAKIELGAVTKSRDQFQAENAQLLRQVKMYMSKIKKLEENR